MLPRLLQVASPTEYDQSEYAGLPVDCCMFICMFIRRIN
jgi:hypothetical protein